MSVKASNWVWEQQLTGPQKLVLLCLADHADNDGVCWPGLAAVSEKTGIKERTLFKVVKELEDEGLIEIERRRGTGGKQQTNRYQLDIKDRRKVGSPGANIAPGEGGEAGCKIEGSPGAKNDDNRVQLAAPGTTKDVRTVNEPSVESSARVRAPEPQGFQFAETTQAQWRLLFPGIDLDVEILKAWQWTQGPPVQPIRDPVRFMTSWLKRAHADSYRGAPPAPPHTTSKSEPYACAVCGKAGCTLGSGKEWFCDDHEPVGLCS